VSHALVTIISKIPHERFATARTLAESLGNPASPQVHAALEAVGAGSDDIGIHFASLTVFPATAGGGHLVFEFSGDGRQDALLRALATHLAPHVTDLFAMAVDRGSASLEHYWAAHVVSVGHGLSDNPGVLFAGTPGLSVKRIRDERALRHHLELLIQNVAVHGATLAEVAAIRAQLRDDAQWHWALAAEDADALNSERPSLEAVRKIGWSVFTMYLWPLIVPALLVFGLALVRDFSVGGFGRAVIAGMIAAIVTLIIVAAVGLFAYLAFRRKENSDSPDDRAPDPRAVARIVERENHAAQNHLAGISTMKPGLLRRIAVKLVFAAIAQLATHLYRPGWLGTLGTIHFARWVMVPGTADLVFLSNYGGSWESYLEDFITKAHHGLTGVWSNSQGFPRTANLIQLGARDGDRFKRWARRQQVPTGCWYSAYPDLTTAIIRTNAAIRQGLGTILTEEEARRWLTLFGSRPRPATAMEVNEIQSLAFGGLGFLRYGMCVAFALKEGREDTRAWLRELLDTIAFGDGRKHGDHAIILALGATGLEKLHLPAESLATFPPAFIDGMASASRARILGDEHSNAADKWDWGGPTQPVDGVLLLYAVSETAITDLRQRMETCLTDRGHRSVVDVEFVTLPDKDAPARERDRAKLEPFGFVDGISQPIIRGTYKSFRAADPIHLVEPGEFILGYPDNRGNLPAGPTLAATHDSDNILPIAASPQHGFARPIVSDARDLGRNGTFLAVRQLEQDFAGFWDYCSDAAAQVQQRFPGWINVTAEFIAAKLVGRWPDGSSLVRFPYQAGSEQEEEHVMTRPSGGAVMLRHAVPSPPPPAAAAALQQASATKRTGRAPVPAQRTQKTERNIAITPDNDFLFGAEDAQGLRCPFGAHIRRANPRESFDPGSEEQLAITNRHRILRVGRRYQPKQGRNDGLFFMCLNADIERQFEFIQQTWLQSPSFSALTRERDPILGSRHTTDASRADDGFTIPTRDAPVRLRSMPEFVRTLGGGYFFIPGKSLLRYLAS
jgi:deferrochelatase/peroxidase EfeB